MREAEANSRYYRERAREEQRRAAEQERINAELFKKLSDELRRQSRSVCRPEEIEAAMTRARNEVLRRNPQAARSEQELAALRAGAERLQQIRQDLAGRPISNDRARQELRPLAESQLQRQRVPITEEAVTKQLTEIINSAKGGFTLRLVRPGEYFFRYHSGNREGDFVTGTIFSGPGASERAQDALNLRPYQNRATDRQIVRAKCEAWILESDVRGWKGERVKQVILLDRSRFEFIDFGKTDSPPPAIFPLRPVP